MAFKKDDVFIFSIFTIIVRRVLHLHQLTWYKWLCYCDSLEATLARHSNLNKVASGVLALASKLFEHLSSVFGFRFGSLRKNPVCLLLQILVFVWVDDFVVAAAAEDDDVVIVVDPVDCSTWLHYWQLLWHSNSTMLNYAKSMSLIARICFVEFLLHRSVFSIFH